MSLTRQPGRGEEYIELRSSWGANIGGSPGAVESAIRAAKGRREKIQLRAKEAKANAAAAKAAALHEKKLAAAEMALVRAREVAENKMEADERESRQAEAKKDYVASLQKKSNSPRRNSPKRSEAKYSPPDIDEGRGISQSEWDEERRYNQRREEEENESFGAVDGQKWGIAAASNNNSLSSFELPPRKPRMNSGRSNTAGTRNVSKVVVDSAETDRIASILGFGKVEKSSKAYYSDDDLDSF